MAQGRPNQMTVEVVATSKSSVVRDLAAKDFKLWEDNKEQAVTGVVFEPRAKHAIVLLFDNTTVSVGLQSDIRNYVTRFIDAQPKPNSYIEVAKYLAGIKILQPFTTDATLLKSALTGTASSGSLGNL